MEHKSEIKRRDSEDLRVINSDLSAAILASTNIGCWQMDMTGRKLLGCRTFKAFFELDEDQWNYISLLRVIDEQSRDRLADALKNISDNDCFSLEIKYLSTKGQRYKWARVTGKAQISYGGKLEKLAGLIEDISDAKNRDQENLDRIAFLNHELRTPLTTMRLFLQRALLSLGKESEMVNILLQKANTQITEMQSLTEDYLNQSIFDNGSIRLNKEHYNLVVSIKQIADEYADQYPNYIFNVDMPPELYVLADRAKIAQVVTNLLNNSIKYSNAGSTISLHLYKQSAHVLVAIADEGIGIGQADLSRLFERFFRSAEAYVGKKKGYGIGLHLVERIIAAHNGRIAATSCLSFGSEFYFTLPSKG